MSTHGFVEEDDLILYAMQALSPSEMELIRRRVHTEPGLAKRLSEIEQVLGSYASATVPLQDVPASALERLTDALAPQTTLAPRAAVVSDSVRTPWGMRLGLLWGGWAVAAMLLIGLAIQYRSSKQAERTVADKNSSLEASQTSLQSAQNSLQAAQNQIATMAADRQHLSDALQQQSSQAQASRQEADAAKNHSAELDAKVAGSRLRADQETARADQLAADARQNAEARAQLDAALTREQQNAARAAESQQVLSALADPTALHVTLTEPKQKKRPSGRGTYLASNGTLVFTGSNLSPLPANRVYELWLMPSDGSAPIPAGTFTPDASGNATLIASHFQKVAAKGFAITAEAAGGSLTPTLPILLAGGA